jgi:hypothetical protein
VICMAQTNIGFGCLSWFGLNNRPTAAGERWQPGDRQRPLEIDPLAASIL